MERGGCHELCFTSDGELGYGQLVSPMRMRIIGMDDCLLWKVLCVQKGLRCDWTLPSQRYAYFLVHT